MRQSIVLGLLLTTAACALPAPSTPSSGPFRFTGTVSGMEGTRTGGPIAGAELSVVSGVNSNARVLSDATGRYLFEGLESGRFTVSVSAPGYVSATPVVDLYRDTDANFALKPR